MFVLLEVGCNYLLVLNFCCMLVWVSVLVCFWLVGVVVEGNLCLVLWVVVVVCEYILLMFGFVFLGLGWLYICEWIIEGGYLVECC